MSELSQLEALLGINSLTEAQVEWYLENEDIMALEFDPNLKNDPILIGDRVIQNWSHAKKGYLGALNRYCQILRHNKFWNRVENGEDHGKIRVVSEGDSWFNYPLLIREVIDQIFDDFSILSMGYAGDWLANIYKENEYINAMQRYEPDIFLVSGGGNDMVGGQRMMNVLRPYSQGAGVRDVVKEDVLQSMMLDFDTIYRSMFDKVLAQHPNVKIICHGYDYPWFGGKEKKWFGVPFRRMGIIHEGLRNEIGGYLIDHFNQMMYSVASDYPGRVHFLNNTGLVPRNLWKDELHPKELGFTVIAEQFREKMYEVV